jgi:hypothetical protein
VSELPLLPVVVVVGGRITLGPDLPADEEPVAGATFRVPIPLPHQVRATRGRVWLRLRPLRINAPGGDALEKRMTIRVDGRERCVDVPVHSLVPIYLGRLTPNASADLEVSGARSVELEPLFLVDDTPAPEAPPRPLWEELARVVVRRVLR